MKDVAEKTTFTLSDPDLAGVHTCASVGPAPPSEPDRESDDESSGEPDDRVHELTAGAGVDLVVDPVGGDRFTDSLRSLAPEGRLLVVGFTAGEIPTVRVNRLLLNNIDVVGVGWGAFALNRPGYLARQWAELEPHLRSGALNPLISATVSLELAADALAVIDERRVTGKVVLQL